MIDYILIQILGIIDAHNLAIIDTSISILYYMINKSELALSGEKISL